MKDIYIERVDGIVTKVEAEQPLMGSFSVEANGENLGKVKDLKCLLQVHPPIKVKVKNNWGEW